MVRVVSGLSENVRSKRLGLRAETLGFLAWKRWSTSLVQDHLR